MRLRTQAITSARAAYEAEMCDSCRVMTRSLDADSVGGMLPSWSIGDEEPCSFSPLSAVESPTTGSTLAVIVARARVPVGTAVGRNDRLSITRRYGSELAVPEEYEVIGEPRETFGYLLIELAEASR